MEHKGGVDPERASSTPPPPRGPSVSANHDASTEQAPSLPTRAGAWLRSSHRLHGIVIAVLAVALIGAVSIYQNRLHQTQVRAANERAALLDQTARDQRARTAELLKLSGLPLAWAIREALLKQHLADVDAYLARIVQQRNVTRVVLAGIDGKVRLATDRKLQGNPVGSVFPGVALDAAEPAVKEGGDEILVIVPIMGLDRRLGTLIYGYATPGRASSGS